MRFYKHLYCSESVLKDKRKIQYKLKHRKLTRDVYVITPASNEANLLDIHQANTFLQPHYKKEDIFVLGIAKGKDEAMELATLMISDVYKATNAFDIKQYVDNK